MAGRLECVAYLVYTCMCVLQRKFSAAEQCLQAAVSAEGAGGEAGEASPAPADISARLAAAVGALQTVQRECTRALPLAGHEPDSVRAQLRNCLVSTRTFN